MSNQPRSNELNRGKLYIPKFLKYFKKMIVNFFCYLANNYQSSSNHNSYRKRRFVSLPMEFHESCLNYCGKKRRNTSNMTMVPASHLLMGGVNFQDPLNLKSTKTNDDQCNISGNNHDNSNKIDRSPDNSKEMVNVLIPSNLQDPLNLTHSDCPKESDLISADSITNKSTSGGGIIINHNYNPHCNKRQRTSSESEIHRQMSLPSTSKTLSAMIKDDSCLNHHCYHNIQSSSSLIQSSSTTTTSKTIRKPPLLQRCSSKNCCTHNNDNNDHKRYTNNICDTNFRSDRSKQPLNHSHQQPQQQHPNSIKSNTKQQKQKERFQYGNYNRYYGYRTMENDEDPRIELFRPEWFTDKDVLDIGCNVGQVTMKIAQNFHPKKIIGIDIDQSLIKVAKKNVRQIVTKKTIEKEKFPLSLPVLYGQFDSLPNVDDETVNDFPNNVNFVQVNYVPTSDDKLEYQKPEYDCILCLSVTKWIHLNWGDAALKRAFRRMFLQLRPGGSLILEPQPWSSYKKAKMSVSQFFFNFGN